MTAVRLLGPVAVLDADERPVPLGRKERAILAVLGVHEGEIVSEDVLTDALWGDDPPATATKTLRSYVSRLRSALGDAATITSEASGYRLVCEQATDTWAVEELLTMGSAAAAAELPAIAAALYRDALASWRGRSLGDLADEPWAVADAARLDELRITALEARIAADLACGRHAELVGELESLTATHPYRERLWEARMLALYRSGRQADALRAYSEVRTSLADELGLEPGPALRDLEGRILRHDPSLGGGPVAPVAQLPSGVVTFLLTDIVGSTRLWETSPQRMAAATARHDELVSAAVAEHGGNLLKTRGEGDSTFSVFMRTSDALRAASALQHALAVAAADGVELTVRAALHVGQAVEREGDYFGPAVNRTARLRAIAQPGEVLLTRAAAELVLDDATCDVPIVEVGERVLKDLARPEQVYRLATVAPPATSATQSTPQRPALPSALAARDPHVGREEELATLRAALQDAMAGGRRAVFVGGEPGIGKTSLVAEVAREADAAGAIVLFGRCDGEAGLPLQPFAEALQPLLQHGPLAQSGRELVRVVPDAPALRGLPGPTGADAETERWLLHEAVVDLLDGRGPVVLVIDDLHWARLPTLLLLRHLLRTDRRSPLLVLTTYRNTELDRTHPLSAMLGDLRREPGVARLALRGFDAVSVAALVAAHHGDADIVPALHAETGGNPYFAVEVLRHVADSGEQSLPESVRDVLSRRLDRLSETTNSVLRAAAVLAPSFSLRLLPVLPAPSVDDVFDAIDEAVAAELVVDDGSTLSFRHALVRQTLLDELTTSRRVRLHRQLADAIAALPDADSHVELLALHCAEAAVAGRPEDAAIYGVAAAERAFAAGAYDHAASVAERALEALESNGVDDPALRAPLRMVLFRAWSGATAVTQAQHAELGLATLEDALRADDDHLIVAALGVIEPMLGVLEAPAVLPIVERLARADGLDGDERALLLALRACNPPTLVEDGLRMLDEAEALATPDSPRLALVLRRRARVLSGLPRPRELLALADRLEALPSESLDLWARNEILACRAVGATELCDRALLEAQGVAEAERRRRIESWQHEAVHFVAEAQRAQLDGDWEAMAATSAGLLEYATAGNTESMATWAGLELVRHREIGRIGDFLPLLEAAATDSPFATPFQAALAMASAEAGRGDEARALLDVVVPTLEAPVTDRNWSIACFSAADAAVTLGDAAHAARLLPLLEPWAGLLMSPSGGAITLGLVDTLLAGLHLTVGEADRAIEHASRAVALADQMSSPPLRARALLWLGRAQLAAGDDGARATLADAAALAGRLGMAGVASAARSS